MTQNSQSFNTVAPLRNVTELNALVKKLKTRKQGMPGMACFSGPSGFGKTVACVYVVLKQRCYHIEVKKHWSQKTFCEKAAEIMGLVPKKKTVSGYFDAICEHLSITQSPFLIDDAQFAAARGYVELLKDIYEGSGAPVILIGEEDLPTLLARIERVHNRLLDSPQAQPTNFADAKHLAGMYCGDVAFSDDLIEAVVEVSRGVARRVVVNLNNAGDLAAKLGKDTLSLADWQAHSQKDFFTGRAPASRRGFK